MDVGRISDIHGRYLRHLGDPREYRFHFDETTFDNKRSGSRPNLLLHRFAATGCKRRRRIDGEALEGPVARANNDVGVDNPKQNIKEGGGGEEEEEKKERRSPPAGPVPC